MRMTKKRGRKSKRPADLSDERLLLLYSVNSARELAEEFGCAESTMKAWIKKAKDHEEERNRG